MFKGLISTDRPSGHCASGQIGAMSVVRSQMGLIFPLTHKQAHAASAGEVIATQIRTNRDTGFIFIPVPRASFTLVSLKDTQPNTGRPVRAFL